MALAIGAMIGWIWVLFAGYWVQTAGSVGTVIAFAAGGLAIVVIGLTYSELASAMPKAGGEHVYTHRAMGSSWSFVCTWSLLFTYLIICMFEAVALPTAVEYLLPQIRIHSLWEFQGADVDLGFVIIGFLGALLMTYVNVRGIKAAATLQVVITAVIFVVGLLLIVGAISFGELSNARPWLATPASGVLKVLIMVPALLVGFDVIPQSAEEIDLPPKRIAKLMVVSVMIAVAWYVAVSFAVAVALTGDELAGSTLAAGDAASALWGSSWAGAALVVGGIGGILTSWNAFLIGGSRVLFALSESGMVPKVFGRLHPRYKTPYVAVIVIGIFSCLAPLLGRAVLVWMVNASSFAVVIAYLMVAIAFLILRRREPDMPRPFTVSHPNLVGYGAVAMSLALLCLFLPWSPSALVWPYEWGMLLLWAVLGLLLFIRYRN
jgi:amino acid transporter